MHGHTFSPWRTLLLHVGHAARLRPVQVVAAGKAAVRHRLTRRRPVGAPAFLWWEERGRTVAERGGGHGAATMVIFNLKNMAPDDYADKRQHEVSGGPVQIIISPDDARL